MIFKQESHTNLIMKMKEVSKAVLLVVDEKTDEFFSVHNLSPSLEHLSGPLNLNRSNNCVKKEDIFLNNYQPQYDKNLKGQYNTF